MSEKTGLENQEQQADKNIIFGNPTGINSSDKSMLEMTPTNRLIFDPLQSALQLAANMIHRALVETDNRVIGYKKVTDENMSSGWRMEKNIIDNWAWIPEIDNIVRTNQLTLKGYSRSQHLRQNASQSGMYLEEDERGLLQRLFGG